ncbi:MAG: acetylglutamate kinase [Alistipes sp.]|nr:acetylglutamate kinase [Alistipes sp.]
MDILKVIKIGGNVIDNDLALERFLRDFASLEGRKILVHGGGKLATRMAERLEIKQTMVEGRRVTDKATLDIVTMVYAGLINKRIVAMLQSFGCNAMGMSGADGAIIRANRRSPEPIDFGFVGDIAEVDGKRLQQLTSEGITPVICSIMHDGKGGLLNCNADSVASAVAAGVAREEAAELHFCFDKAGVLRDVNDPTTLISEITAESYPSLRAEGVISDGMIPKVENALRSVAEGLQRVVIKHSDELTNPEAGTSIR